MIYNEQRSVRFAQFDGFQDVPVIHAFFTRHGGVSPAPWASLNMGGGLGDSRENIIENRQRAFDSVQRQVESLYDVWQVHGVEVVCTDAPRPLDAQHVKADIILTNHPEITLFMRFADCVPVMLVDPVKRVVGLVHAGWQGTLKKAPAVAVQAMHDRYGCQPKDILAGIGPSIGVEHYEVGSDVVERTRQAFGQDASGLLRQMDGCTHLDLWAANRLTLENAGVQQVEVSGICTACHMENWYSHRGEHGKTGRYGAVIALRNS